MALHKYKVISVTFGSGINFNGGVDGLKIGTTDMDLEVEVVMGAPHGSRTWT